MDEVRARLEQRKRYAQVMGFSYKSAMTFIFDLENWFKITTHPLFKSPIYLKYEPNRANWKVYTL